MRDELGYQTTRDAVSSRLLPTREVTETFPARHATWRNYRTVQRACTLGFFKFTRATRAVPFLVPLLVPRSQAVAASLHPFVVPPRPLVVTSLPLPPPPPAVGGFNDLTAKNRARRPRDTAA